MARKYRKGDPKPEPKTRTRPLPTRDDVVTFIRDNPDRATKRDVAKAFNLKGDDRVAAHGSACRHEPRPPCRRQQYEYHGDEGRGPTGIRSLKAVELCRHQPDEEEGECDADRAAHDGENGGLADHQEHLGV